MSFSGDDSDAGARVLESSPEQDQQHPDQPDGKSPEEQEPKTKKRRKDTPSAEHHKVSETEEQYRTQPETIAFEEHGDGRFGQQSLYKFLNDDELAVLVELATNLSDTNTSVPLDRMKGDGSHQNTDHHTRSNPLLGLPNSPLPLSFLNFLSQRSLTLPNFKEAEIFDNSALVAVGIILEEILTASMLPLARLHVLRCRELEDLAASAAKEPDNFGQAFQMDEPENPPLDPITGEVMQVTPNIPRRDANDADPFEEWTLPPEEALQKILTEQKLPFKNCGLPPSQTATRTIDINIDLTDNPSEGMFQESFLEWCRIQSLDPSFVRQNMDLFKVFVSCGTEQREGTS